MGASRLPKRGLHQLLAALVLVAALPFSAQVMAEVTPDLRIASAEVVSTFVPHQIVASASTCADGGICAVGDTGPGGGIVFYVHDDADDLFTSTGSDCGTNCRYLEVAPTGWADSTTVDDLCAIPGTSSADPNCSWSGSTASAVATGTQLGTGFANTQAAVGQVGGGDTPGRAITVAWNYSNNAKSDWYLPSRNELYALHSQRALVGGFAAGYYWSSTDAHPYAWVQNFGGNNEFDYGSKTSGYWVRPIRAFGFPHRVTYDGNGSDGGAVPNDGGAYEEGGTVTVLGNTGSLSKSGYVFDGWCTTQPAAGSSCGGTSRAATSTFIITSEVTLYAVWSNKPGPPELNAGSIRIIVDNDYALFLGSATTATSLKNQNNVDWGSQINSASSLDIGGDGEYLYLVAMGGGGAENFGGTINNVDMTTVVGVQRAVSGAACGGSTSDSWLLITSCISGFSSASAAAGTQDVTLSQLQTALSVVMWGAMPAHSVGTDQVGGRGTFENGTQTGTYWSFPSDSAVVVRFPKSSLRFPVAGDGEATVFWVAPSTGGGPTSYTVTAYLAADESNSDRSCSTTNLADLSCTITGLANGTAYKFKITATNSSGTSEPSVFTASVTPTDLTPPNVTLARTAETSATTSISFTVTGNEAIDCTTLSTVAGQDFALTNISAITSIVQTSSTMCTVTATSTAPPGGSPVVSSLASAAGFSVADAAGNAQTVLAGSPQSITVTAPPSCAMGGVCVVGDTGPAGGIVFYVAGSAFTSTGSDCDDNCLYLEAAPTDISIGAPWATATMSCFANGSDTANQSCITASIYSNPDGQAASRSASRSIGMGLRNSEAIVARHQVGGVPSNGYAAGLARSVTLGGQNDWYLPSQAELNELYRQRTQLGDIVHCCYWSSTEIGLWGSTAESDLALYQHLNTGAFDGATWSESKSRLFRVRPIRAFGPQRFTVTYDGNTSTSGAVPTDSTRHVNSTSVTVLPAGSLAKSGFTFGGWCTSRPAVGAACAGVSRSVGSTFSIGSDVTLYAVWNANPPQATTTTVRQDSGSVTTTTAVTVPSSTTTTIARPGATNGRRTTATTTTIRQVSTTTVGTTSPRPLVPVTSTTVAGPIREPLVQPSTTTVRASGAPSTRVLVEIVSTTTTLIPSPTTARPPGQVPTPQQIVEAIARQESNVQDLSVPVYVRSSLPEPEPQTPLVIQTGADALLDVITINEQVIQLQDTRGFRLSVSAIDASGELTKVSRSGAILVQRRSFISVSGEGFKPNSDAVAWLFSQPRRLGVVQVGEDGTFEETLQIGEEIEAGRHTTQVNGITPDGEVRSLNLAVEIIDPAAASTRSGRNLTTWLGLALGSGALVVVALAARRRWLLAFGRRRRHDEDHRMR
jgi:hypothetical protein